MIAASIMRFAEDFPAIPDTPTTAMYLYGTPANGVSYNGTVLPDIESVWDKQKYPYVAVFDFASDGMGYILHTYQNVEQQVNENECYVASGMIALFSLADNVWTMMNEDTADGFEVSPNVVLWSNFDILNSDGSVYLAATAPVKSGNIGLRVANSEKMVYGGMELPNIDAVWTDELKQTHPYVEIADCGDIGGMLPSGSKMYMLVISDTPIVAGAEITAYAFSLYEGVDGTIFEELAGNWFDAMDGEPITDVFTPESMGFTIWANHDILNADGSIYLAASEPVSSDTVVYYDGVVILKIPDKVMAYPYVILTKSGTNWYVAYGMDEKPYTELYKNLLGSYDRLRLDSGNYCPAEYQLTEWSYIGEEESVTEWAVGYANWKLSNILWSNFDINASDGSVYLSEGESIPVGEIVDYINDIPIYEVIT